MRILHSSFNAEKAPGKDNDQECYDNESECEPVHRRLLTNRHPSNGLTVAQVGLPSFPVPGTEVSRSAFAFAINQSMVSQAMPRNGIFKRRLQQLSCCPAYVPISM